MPSSFGEASSSPPFLQVYPTTAIIKAQEQPTPARVRIPQLDSTNFFLESASVNVGTSDSMCTGSVDGKLDGFDEELMLGAIDSLGIVLGVSDGLRVGILLGTTLGTALG